MKASERRPAVRRASPPPRASTIPRHEHDACGVGFVVDIKGARSHAHRAPGAPGPHQPAAPRRLRLRGQHRRRRRHPAADARPLPAARVRAARHRPARRRRVRRRPRLPAARPAASATRSRALHRRRSSPRKASGCSAGATCRPTTARSAPSARARWSRTSSRSSSAAARAACATTRTSSASSTCIRKRIEHAVDATRLRREALTYLPSLSSQHAHLQGHALARTRSSRCSPIWPIPDVESALALVHQRFSTNTFPSWPLAHPYRYIAHNGEINTLRGNINWMRAREALCRSERPRRRSRQGASRSRAKGCSDSATFDNVLEFLVMNGRSLPHAILMMIPEPWQQPRVDEPGAPGVLRVPLLAHGAVGRPGLDRVHRRHRHRRRARPQRPAALALLRHQGRPRRSWPPRSACSTSRPRTSSLKERLHPGKIFLVDTAQGRIIDDEEIKAELAAEHPYARRGCAQNLVRIEDLPGAPGARRPTTTTVLTRQIAFGYTHEDLRLLLAPDGEERRGADRLDGHRHRAGRALRPAAAALRLLQAALRAGHEPAPRPDPRGAGDVDGVDGRARAATCSKPEPESCRQIVHQGPGALQRASSPSSAHVAHRVASRPITLPMLYPVGGGRRRPRARARRAAARGPARPSPTATNIVILSDRGVEPRARGHPEPARDGGRAPSPRAARRAHALRARHRDRRRARGAPRVPADRLRRRRRQPVGGLRDARRHDPPGHAGRASTAPRPSRTTSRRSTRESSRSWPRWGSRRCRATAARRSSRPSASNRDVVDRYFTGTASRVGGIGLDVDRRGGPAPPRATRSRSGRWAVPSSTGAASTSGGATASTTCSTRTRSPSSSTRRAQRQLPRLQGLLAARRRPEPAARDPARAHRR